MFVKILFETMKKGICTFCCAKCSRQEEFATKNFVSYWDGIKIFQLLSICYARTSKNQEILNRSFYNSSFHYFNLDMILFQFNSFW